ncbi:MAG: hypothetical protein ACRC6I_09115, partial [Paracoccaceae bacterium]
MLAVARQHCVSATGRDVCGNNPGPDWPNSGHLPYNRREWPVVSPPEDQLESALPPVSPNAFA